MASTPLFHGREDHASVHSGGGSGSDLAVASPVFGKAPVFGKGVDLKNQVESLLTTTIVRRPLGIVAASWLARYTPECFATDASGEFKKNGLAASLVRSSSDWLNKGFNLIFGENRSHYEVTPKAVEELGALRAQFIPANQENIDKGYVRERHYSVSLDETHLSDAELKHRHMDYGKRVWIVSADFAGMGMVDNAASQVVDVVRGKKTFGAAIRDYAENFIRGDGLYDFLVGLAYVGRKEAHWRKVDRDEHPHVKSHKRNDPAFTDYNLIGMVALQDFLVDWWLRPSKSRWRNYLAEHREEGVSGAKGFWNDVINTVSFGLNRLIQVGVGVYIAARTSFSGHRQEGIEQIEDLRHAREQGYVMMIASSLQQKFALPDAELETIVSACHQCGFANEKFPSASLSATAKREKLCAKLQEIYPQHAAELPGYIEEISKNFYADYLKNPRAERAPHVQHIRDPHHTIEGELYHAVDRAFAIDTVPMLSNAYATEGVQLVQSIKTAMDQLQGKETDLSSYEKSIDLMEGAGERVGYIHYFAAKRWLHSWMMDSQFGGCVDNTLRVLASPLVFKGKEESLPGASQHETARMQIEKT